MWQLYNHSGVTVMKKFYFVMVLISITVATVSTSANGKSTLQADIDAGATPLTTSQITSVYTNNTIVDSGYYVYYSEGGKKIVLNTKNNKKYKRKGRWMKQKDCAKNSVGL